MKIIIELIIYMAILLLIYAAVVHLYDKYVCRRNDKNIEIPGGRSKMSKYILELIDKNPANNMTIECDNATEVVEYKRKAQKMGFEIRVKEERMNIFKKKPKPKQKVKPIFEITDRSNIVQHDDMGYPLRLVIINDKEQIWIDTYEEEGDIELKWKGVPK